jgi:pyruvate-ferredoxin/flavodoxin oxidoreductase
VQAGHWPLYRFNPLLAEAGKNPLVLDSKEPSVPLEQYLYSETRYQMLTRSDPARAAELLQLAKQDARRRWAEYQELAKVDS